MKKRVERPQLDKGRSFEVCERYTVGELHAVQRSRIGGYKLGQLGPDIVKAAPIIKHLPAPPP